MTYSDFTLDDAVARLGVSTTGAELFPGLAPADVPPWLSGVLGAAPTITGLNEKARSEFLVAPVLAAVRALSGWRLAVFSGLRLDVDPAAGLAGECDFLIAAGPDVLPVRGPVLTVVEAKRGDVDLGLGQAIAQAVAADRFNKAAGVTGLTVYGCVTSGEIWQFLRLDGTTVTFDPHRLYLADVRRIVATLLAIGGQPFSPPPAAGPPSGRAAPPARP